MTLLAITRIGTLASGGLAGFGAGASAMVAEMSRQRSLSGSGGAAATTASAALLRTRSIEGVGAAASEAEGGIIALTSVSIGGNGDSASAADATMAPIRGLEGVGATAAETEGALVPTGVTVAIAGTSSEASAGGGEHVTPYFMYQWLAHDNKQWLAIIDLFYATPTIIWARSFEAADRSHDPDAGFMDTGVNAAHVTSYQDTMHIGADNFGHDTNPWFWEYDFGTDLTTRIDIDHSMYPYPIGDFSMLDYCHQNDQYMWFVGRNFTSGDEHQFLWQIDKTTSPSWTVVNYYRIAEGTSGSTTYGSSSGIAFDGTNLIVSSSGSTWHVHSTADGSLITTYTGPSDRRSLSYQPGTDSFWGYRGFSPESQQASSAGTLLQSLNAADCAVADTTPIDPSMSRTFGQFGFVSKAIHYSTKQLGGSGSSASDGEALSVRPTLIGAGNTAADIEADLTNHAWMFVTSAPSGIGSWHNVLDDSYGVGWRANFDLVVRKMRVWSEGAFTGHLTLRVGTINNVVVTQPVEAAGANVWVEAFGGDYPVLEGEDVWIVAHADAATIARWNSTDRGQSNGLYDGDTFLAAPTTPWAVSNSNDNSPNATVSEHATWSDDWIGVDVMFLPGTNDNTFMGGSGGSASTMANADLTVIAPTIQWLRPMDDIAIGGWTNNFGGTLNIYNGIDDTAPDDDTTYITDNQGGETYDGHFSDPGSPVGTGDHILRVRARKDAAGGNDRGLTVELLQGGTAIATMSDLNLVETYVDLQMTLTPTQVSNITDYTDLRIRLISSGTTGGPGGNRRSVRVTWVELEIPA